MRNFISGITPSFIFASLLVFMAMLLGVFTGWISSSRQLTPLEAGLTQGVILIFALAGSFWGGSLSANKIAQQLVRPYARSGFRRVRAIYFGLSDIAKELSNYSSIENAPPDWALAIGRMQSTASAHLATADDAMDEWKDLVPEEVNELREELAARLNVSSVELRGVEND